MICKESSGIIGDYQGILRNHRCYKNKIIFLNVRYVGLENTIEHPIVPRVLPRRVATKIHVRNVSFDKDLRNIKIDKTFTKTLVYIYFLYKLETF